MRSVCSTLALISSLTLVIDAGYAQVKLKPEVEFGTKRKELPLGESTEVKGKVPAGLPGIWLIVEDYSFSKGHSAVPRKGHSSDPGKGGNSDPGKGGGYYPGACVYQIREADGKLSVNRLDDKVLEGVQPQINKARTDHQQWTPNKEQIAAIQQAVNKMVAEPGQSPEQANLWRATKPGDRVLHQVLGRDAFTKSMTVNPESKNAVAALSSAFQPKDAALYGVSYYIRTIKKEEITGAAHFGALTMNAAGAPLPIALSGEFRMIRLQEPMPAKAPKSDAKSGSRAPN
jgi:hypothetical protein